ncbi:MAG: SAM-dependent methyltransferase [uncultured Sphingomonadaceae bacterium]|uniref:SAM-dependent methyltransferase n=1 Tax=uncultured Sphingomonadaceae bacterium TaxID=169976 RepID=A0A6J4TUS2_9SPHN|nr:MAG: SAM-dependent methyltransferase [uncultured Sphingomonadaceae bacterium]
MTFANTFAQGSDAYAAARPLYPQDLLDWIASACRNHDAAWDCATGNGQAAVALARIFQRVEATDVSAAQVAEAFAAPNVRYSAQPAESTAFADRSFDLITVAQALHWFDYELFWPEVRRVARPGALFCAWGYAWFRGDPDVENKLLGPVAKLVEPYWAAQNRILWNSYRDADTLCPFDRLEAPELRIVVDWSVDRIIAYVRTWSAYKRAAADGLETQLEATLAEARRRLDPDTSHQLWVPLAIRAGYVE